MSPAKNKNAFLLLLNDYIFFFTDNLTFKLLENKKKIFQQDLRTFKMQINGSCNFFFF